jgi:mRNA interferase YafQ
MRKRGKDLKKLKAVLDLLVEGDTLPVRFRDHPLSGNWNGYRDLHTEPDWVLIYRVADDELRLARTGTHADIFDE